MMEELKKAYEVYMQNGTSFEKGEELEWKPGLRNKQFNGPFIYMGKTARENFEDACVCTLLSDGTFWTGTLDSKRLQRRKAVEGMSFAEAFEKMKNGAMVKRPHWVFYIRMTADGQILDDKGSSWKPWADAFTDNDWVIAYSAEGWK